MFYVYLLQSEKDGSFYIGYTSNLELRIKEHNNGKGRYTNKKTPWSLVYVERFAIKSDALRRERFLKRQKNRAFYEKLIRGRSSVG
ncbi:GIY-YIG nuclease family protein [candidate division KSB1 bacterium]|nr:GIY-YIG nuclease family protein [candidate division KSB1 bacterium]